jgi:hypothetical protein
MMFCKLLSIRLLMLPERASSCVQLQGDTTNEKRIVALMEWLLDEKCLAPHVRILNRGHLCSIEYVIVQLSLPKTNSSLTHRNYTRLTKTNQPSTMIPPSHILNSQKVPHFSHFPEVLKLQKQNPPTLSFKIVLRIWRPHLIQYSQLRPRTKRVPFSYQRPSVKFTTMSWMDSWSRPKKSSATPPPLYLTREGVKYCQSCGRVMSARKDHKSQDTPAKYCSARCRSQKPGTLDQNIEDAFLGLMSGAGGTAKRRSKGDSRVIILCSEVEEIIFGERSDPTKTSGRKKNRAARAIGGEDEEEEWKSVDMMESDKELLDSDFVAIEVARTGFAGKVRPPQNKTDINGSIGGEKGWAERIDETAEAAAKRMEGQRIAEEKEMVKRAARRGCVFGFVVDQGMEKQRNGGKKNKGSETAERRLCEAVMNGAVVEPSFAKGDWGIRWRE